VDVPLPAIVFKPFVKIFHFSKRYEIVGSDSSLTADWICMKDDQLRFLTLLGQLPARLTAEQAGWVLNCQPHDIPALIHARLLKPLGNPSQNSTKYFATADILEMTKDRAWLVKVSNTICQHWQKQNARKKDHAFNGERNGHASLAAV
jgi:hypothetical protein